MRKSCCAILILLSLILSSTPDCFAREGERLIRSLTPGESPRLVPDGSMAPLLRKTDGSWNIGVESLYTVSMPAAMASCSSDDTLLILLNHLLALHSLEGIQYYSVSRGKERTLFLAAYAVLSPEDPVPVPDAGFSDMPEEYRIVLFQEDTTFGKGFSEVEYLTAGDSILMSLKNITPLTLGPFTAVEPYGMTIRLYLVPEGGNIRLYAAGTASARFTGLLSSRIEQSLFNRVEALAEWLSRRITGE